jgi:hypothetical protein
VPAEYDAAKKWPLRVQLHGGVGRDLRDDPQPQSARMPGEPQIYIEPQAYWEAAWWHTSQVDNILGLVDFVRRKVQRRRNTDLHHGHFRRRDRHVLLRAARAESVVGVPVAERPAARAREP